MVAKGKFIVFEGTDGSGKSTQLKLLGNYLEGKGIAVCETHEPTDSPFGMLLRSCMTGKVETDEHAIAALFAADRLDHIFNPVGGIERKLEEGCTVLCDRFYLSSFAYNGGLVSSDWVISLNTPAMKLRPDLVIYLDLSPEETMARISRRGERERYETFERQKTIRERYFAMFERFSEENVVIVRSERDRDATQEHVRRAADRLFGF